MIISVCYLLSRLSDSILSLWSYRSLSFYSLANFNSFSNLFLAISMHVSAFSARSTALLFLLGNTGSELSKKRGYPLNLLGALLLCSVSFNLYSDDWPIFDTRTSLFILVTLKSSSWSWYGDTFAFLVKLLPFWTLLRNGDLVFVSMDSITFEWICYLPTCSMSSTSFSLRRVLPLFAFFSKISFYISTVLYWFKGEATFKWVLRFIGLYKILFESLIVGGACLF